MDTTPSTDFSQGVDTSDATPAYRGYRLQALYSLYRILSAQDGDNRIFQPEGTEDLALLNSDKQLVEVNQVKAFGTNLTLSSFKPAKEDSFFYRAARVVKTSPHVAINIVSYGDVGPELKKAIEKNGKERREVVKKLCEHGFIEQEDAEKLFTKLSLELVNETEIKEKVYSVLRAIPGGSDPLSAFRLLHYWLYDCAEKKTHITQEAVIRCINEVGKYLHERAAHHDQWISIIAPIEDVELATSETGRLEDEFYRGVSARYEHVLADLDVIRADKLSAISAKFKKTNVVIIHGASGQGKTTLAYRYLREFFPNYWRFQVRAIESRQHALNIATAIIGHVNAINIPLAIYLDITPQDKDWPELVRQLSVHDNLRILITIREEDFQKANIKGATIDYDELSMSFGEFEAQRLYQALVKVRPSVQFLNFEEAWRAFGGTGPLMEFIYLMTQGRKLYDRLAEQIATLEDDVRVTPLVGEETNRRIISPNELQLLRLISVASAFEGRLHVRPLAAHLGLTNPKKTLQLFQEEYLLRLNDDASIVSGLHPVRSQILAKLLTDETFAPISEVVKECLPFIVEQDIETFLLHVFSSQDINVREIVDALNRYQTDQWISMTGITKALMWLGIRDYVEENREIFDVAYHDAGAGWWIFLDYDIADAMPGVANETWNSLSTMIPEERRQKLEGLRAGQTDKSRVFIYAKQWISTRSTKPVPPTTVSAWSSLAETVYWMGKWGYSSLAGAWLDNIQWVPIIEELPVDVLADTVLGLAEGLPHEFSTWIMKHRAVISHRLRKALLIPVLEDNGEKVTAHFIVTLEPSDEFSINHKARIQAASNRFHEEAMVRIDLIRRLYPDRTLYACQGYGHNVWLQTSPNDDTHKAGIDRKQLPPLWATSVNSIFRNLAVRAYRPKDWLEYAEKLFELRCDVLSSLQQLVEGLEQYFRSYKFKQIIGNAINVENWANCQFHLNHAMLLPACAVDVWGFTDEGAMQTAALDIQSRTGLLSKKGLAFRAYKGLIESYRNYSSHLSNFYSQSNHTLAINVVLGRNTTDKSAKDRVLAKAKELNLRSDFTRISTVNLVNAIKVLPQFQDEYREHLTHLVGAAKLSHTEQKEKELFEKLWPLWYFFSTSPERITNPKNLAQEVTSLVNYVRSALKQEFNKLSDGSIKVEIVSESVRWGDEAALWVTIDADTLTESYALIGEAHQAICKALQKGKDAQLRQYALDLCWPNIVIVPLIQGQAVSETAWRFNYLTLSQSSVLNWWNLVPVQLPSGALENLNIKLFSDDRLTQVQTFMSSITEVSIYTAHLRGLLELPSLDDEGLAQVQQYSEQVSKRMTEVFQITLDTFASIANTYNLLTDEERVNRPFFTQVIRGLLELHPLLMPIHDFENEALLELQQIGDWAERLAKVRELAGIIYTHYISDIFFAEEN